jgi:hypothetical protein
LSKQQFADFSEELVEGGENTVTEFLEREAAKAAATP